ncbi:ribosome small subunit-dependent GTPase A [Paratissierella segnis]|jgi:ribosome biogenesis GTPase|uniref:Small ribosomal subunit biogenesis GTPase RsgA n=1 Tax=Paratissierella segnis TaxID=2763679 RepID=A0A926ILF9_9FIRM|nr:ribosome small subunit-dependent GTPase A [Paratissierella segnis]MBC8588628.1 ribosome small subunit-dependent GTPase A [Paratissierella segnis]
MIEGIIIKGVGGFYYVKTPNGTIECRARGAFREENLTPLVGDNVRIRINKEDNTGYIEEILERKSSLIRPPVANVTQGIVVMSVKKPDINTWLLDRFLIIGEYQNLDMIICFNKTDLSFSETSNLAETYEKIGYRVIITSAKENLGIERLKDILKNHISVFAGPSGVGKSSLLNKINPCFKLETGAISSKSKRGKHTTRHVELFELEENTFVLDSPGFSSLSLDFIEEESELKNYFREIKKYGRDCRFLSCLHDKEPNCNVKKLVEESIISKARYDNYIQFLEEVRKFRRY